MFWTAAEQAGLNVARGAVSISPPATWTALLRLLTYGCAFWLALQTCRSPKRAELAVLLISMMTAAYSAYGFAAYLSGDETILWFKKWAYLGSLTGTFVNRNSFATFVGLGLLCSLAFIVRRMVHASGSPRSSAADLAGGLSTGLFAAMGAATLQATALLLTQSRGGLLSLLCAVFAFFVGIIVKSHRARRWKMAGFGLLLGILAMATLVSGGGIADRMQRLVLSDADQLDRINIYGSTLKAIGDRPFLGFGYGTFEDAFKVYRSDEIRLYFDKAHNTYLQAAMELGIPAAVALIGAVAALAFRSAAGLRRRRSLFVYAWLGAAASLLVGMHALIDFSAQIPAVAVLYGTILGIGCAQSWSGRVDTSSALRGPARAASAADRTRQDSPPAPE
jgi:O-antigen ligase